MNRTKKFVVIGKHPHGPYPEDGIGFSVRGFYSESEAKRVASALNDIAELENTLGGCNEHSSDLSWYEACEPAYVPASQLESKKAWLERRIRRNRAKGMESGEDFELHQSGRKGATFSLADKLKAVL